MANLDQIVNYVADYVTQDWTEADHKTGTATITIPDSAKEVFVIVNCGGTTYRGYSSVPCIGSRWELGGYYNSSSDFGICNLNVTNDGKTYSIRNAKYAGSTHTSTAVIYVYYR